MHVNTLFIILTFIVVIAVIMTADTMQSAATVISLIAGFFVITTLSRDLTRGISSVQENAAAKPSDDQTDHVDTLHTESFDQNTNLYGAQYEEYQSYNTSQDKAPRPVVIDSCAEADTSIDGANCLITQKRARDKRCSDGWAVKDANYFKYHYGTELEEAEAKPWWGRSDY